MSDCLTEILEIIGNIFDAHTVVLFVPRGRELVLRQGFSLSPDLTAQAVILPGQGLVGWVAKENKPLLVKSVDQQKQFLGYYAPGKDRDIKAFMACPLPEGKGVLCLDTKKTYAWSTKDQKIFSQFARFLAEYEGECRRMDNEVQKGVFARTLMDLHALRDQHLKWSDFLQRYLELLTQSSGFSTCFLAARDEVGKNFFIEGMTSPPDVAENIPSGAFPMGSGLVGWLFKNYQPMAIETRAADAAPIALISKDAAHFEMRSAVCLPLLVHKKTRGVLVLADREPREVQEALGRFFRAAADNLALLLENLYLKNRLAGQPAPPQSQT